MNGSQLSRRQLAGMALVRGAAFFVVLAAILFVPAGTLMYWEVWVYFAILFVPMLLVLAYLLKYDPKLLERRMRMRETEVRQRLIVKLGSICYLLIFLLPGFDRRFGWSYVSAAAVVVADVLVLLGYGLCVFVLRENRYASRIIEVEQGQEVITSGPYAIVRHPMYLGGLIMCILTPVALGSWWAVIPALGMVPILVARILNEEQVLAKELEGYQEYMQTTKYRLIPGVW